MINQIIQGDTLEVLKTFPDESVDCVITSPPYYGLRDYGVEGQLGLEKTLDEYLTKMLLITNELKRVLKKTGTMWWNHGDAYNTKPPGNSKDGQINKTFEGDGVYGRLMSRNRDKNFRFEQYKVRASIGVEKCQMLQNYRLILRMIDEQGWILRNQVIWHKPNCMPSSVKDRFTVDYEPVFFFSKAKRYYFEPIYEKYTEPMNRWGGDKLRADGKSDWDKGTGQDTYRDRNMRPNELGRNKRCVWRVSTSPFKDAHFATFPQKLIEPMVKAGCPEFICKKCGKAREKIYKSNWQEKIQEFNNKTKHSKNKESAERRRDTNLYARMGDSNKQDLGYTDCGCNADWNKGIVLDPFMGSGTTAVVAKKLGRNYLGIELNPKYIRMAEKRLAQGVLL